MGRRHVDRRSQGADACAVEQRARFAAIALRLQMGEPGRVAAARSWWRLAVPHRPHRRCPPDRTSRRTAACRCWSYQDLLASAYDDTLFEYATSQLALVDASSGARTPVGRPGIYHTFAPSPDGNFVLVAREAPLLAARALRRLPDAGGGLGPEGHQREAGADLPVADTVPNGGVLRARAHGAGGPAGDRRVDRGARWRRPESHRGASGQTDGAGGAVLGNAVGDRADRVARRPRRRGPTPAC